MRAEMFINSLVLALGLALEAFIVALANGLKTANTRFKTACLFGTVFAVFHSIALWIGYALVKTIANNVSNIESILTWVAVTVLAFLGLKMIAEGVAKKEERRSVKIVEFIAQSAAASVDAFAVGITIPDYTVVDTLVCSSVFICVIFTFYIIGIAVGRRFGNASKTYAAVIGGLVFIGIAIEIAVSAMISR